MRDKIEPRFCGCGCGQVTTLAPETRPEKGWVKGQPRPFSPHHSKRKQSPPEGMKHCASCDQALPVDAFSINRANWLGRHHWCRECASSRVRIWNATERGQMSRKLGRDKHRLSTKFGLTRDEYDRIGETQNWLCAICSKPETSTFRRSIRRLAVDHCHKTGRIRGLLCRKCNQGIGHLRDDVAILRKAITYLEK